MTFNIVDWVDRFGRKYNVVIEEDQKRSEPVPVNLIMLTYNCEDYLDYCLRATEKQVNGVFALDNGSSDRTINILKDHNVNFIKSRIKGDLSKIMNLNLKRVPKGWCFYVNPDEILFDLPDSYIGEYCSFLESNGIHASDVRFPDFVYNYRTLFAGFDWGEGPGVYWTARRLFRYTGSEQFRGTVHYNISNMHPTERGSPKPNNEHTGHWSGTVVKTELVKLFHYGKCRGVEEQRGKGSRLVDGFHIAMGAVPTRPYFGPHPSVMGLR